MTTSTVHTFDRYSDVERALADPLLVPVPVPEPGGPVGSMAWLRAGVARFASGATHERRRLLLETDLAAADPATLRRLVMSRPVAGPEDADDRRRVLRALAAGMGLPEPDAVAERIPAVAAVYFGTEDPGSEAAADAAVTWLLPRMTRPDELGVALEVAANRIGILVQACDATATLIAHARRAAGVPAEPGDPGATPSGTRQDLAAEAAGEPAAGIRQDLPAAAIEALLTETLRHDPPVRAMRRVAVGATSVAGVPVAEGDVVVLDVAAANLDPDILPRPAPLTFGAPPRVCPGRAQALALASGVLESGAAASADVAAPILHLVEHTLKLAETWVSWDGVPRPVDDRVYTPHKAIRRTADHLVDHLAELEARLVGRTPQPDRWHASATTTPADLAPFTAEDLDEARSRLTRIARIWHDRLSTLTPDQLDRSPGEGWTFRELADHLAGSVYYADAVGDLSGAAPTAR